MEIMNTTLDIPLWFLLCLVAINITLGALLLIAAELLQNKLAHAREQRAIRKLESQVIALRDRITADSSEPETVTEEPEPEEEVDLSHLGYGSELFSTGRAKPEVEKPKKPKKPKKTKKPKERKKRRSPADEDKWRGHGSLVSIGRRDEE